MNQTLIISEKSVTTTISLSLLINRRTKGIYLRRFATNSKFLRL